jgi:hypothetical protein
VARVETIADREAIQMLSNELQRRHGLLDDQGLVRVGAMRLSFYRFIHNLFQQYIYNNLNEAERHYLHRDVGTVLEALFAGQTEEIAAKLARHFEVAGMPEKAATYCLQAGTKARRMSANEEAISHLQKGLRLLPEIGHRHSLYRWSWVCRPLWEPPWRRLTAMPRQKCNTPLPAPVNSPIFTPSHARRFLYSLA